MKQTNTYIYYHKPDKSLSVLVMDGQHDWDSVKESLQQESIDYGRTFMLTYELEDIL